MAEGTSQNQNQAFLKEMEKQRLNKLCNRTIDLRGKVKSECQAYKIGDRTHYLDDRAYLIIKQLMARFHGRYTVGVYETVLKAIRKLEQSEQTNTVSKENSVSALPFIEIDHVIQRREQRVLVTLPVRVRIGDVLYHGHTIDIASSALRISMKRSHTMDTGDQVQVELIDEFEREGRDFLQKLPYIVRKIDHDENNTTLILSRVDEQNTEINQWLADWITRLSGHKTIDVDSHIQNQLSDCYLQLWLKRMSPWLLWLQRDEQTVTIKKCHMSRLASQAYNQLSQMHANILESLPLTLSNSTQTDLLLVIHETSVWGCQLDKAEQVRHLLLLHQQYSGSEVLIFKTAAVSAEVEPDNSLIRHIEAVQPQAAHRVLKDINQIKQRGSIYNITPACSLLFPSNETKQDSTQYEFSLQNSLKDVPVPTALSTQTERAAERFFIHTPVTAYIGSDRIKLKTEDVSANGLALTVPDYIEAKINQQIFIDFTRWQELSPNMKLKQIPYLIRNKMIWAGEYHLGLQRVKHNRLYKLESYFTEIINENKENLRENKQDVVDNNENLLYLDLFKPTIKSIPVFLGMDGQNRRTIQMIASTQSNQAKQIPASFWEALKLHITEISERIRELSQNDSQSDNTTIYAYQEQQGRWQITFEEALQSARQKATLIQRLNSAADHRVFLCQLVAIPPTSKTLEKALPDSFLQWRNKRAAKVKQIRQQLHQLYGLMELTDITQLFSQVYPD